MLVGEGGASVPRTVVAANSGGVALLVQAEALGTQLSQLDPDLVTDALLDETWRQARLLHAVRVSHGALDADHLVVDGDVVTVVGWSRAATGADERAAAHDLAQLLAATTAIVGVDRAVAAASRAVDAETLRRVLPLLQPAALSQATRDALERVGDVGEILEQLREHAAEAAGTEVPELRRLSRIRGRQLLMAVSALLAIVFLFSRIGDPSAFWNSIKDASWGFVVLAFFLGLATDVAFAVALLGTVPVRISLWSMIELQSSLSFANLAVPVAADAAMQVRFLQKNGLTLSESVATGGVLSTISEIIIQVTLFGVALWLAPDSIEFGKVDTTQIVVVVLGAIFLIGVAAAVVFSVRRHPSRGDPARRQGGAFDVAHGAVAEPARVHVRRQHRRAVPLRRVAARVPARVRRVAELLHVARGEHRHLADRVPRAAARRRERGVRHRPLGDHGRPRRADRGRDRRGGGAPARGELPPGDPGLVRQQRPRAQRAALRPHR